MKVPGLVCLLFLSLYEWNKTLVCNALLHHPLMCRGTGSAACKSKVGESDWLTMLWCTVVLYCGITVLVCMSNIIDDQKPL